MDRHLHKKWFPNCPRNIALVDQYMWPEKDSTKYMCYNGISHPIYDCKGWINYSLPLEMYPPVNEVHSQIPMVRRPHLQYRENPDKDITEGFYYCGPHGNQCPSKPSLVIASQRTEKGKLPNPYGNTTGRSSCNSCAHGLS